MSGYHQLIQRSIKGTLKNWLLCFGWFSVCEILVKLTLYWVVQLISAGWRLLCAKCMPGKVGKPFNSWPVAMEASKSVIFLPKTKEISGKMENGKKRNSLDSRHVFQSFSLPSSNKRAEKPFSEFLGRFSVILGVPPTGPKKGVPVQTNSAFTPKFKYNGYKTYFSSNKNSHRSGKNFGVNFFL